MLDLYTSINKLGSEKSSLHETEIEILQIMIAFLLWRVFLFSNDLSD